MFRLASIVSLALLLSSCAPAPPPAQSSLASGATVLMVAPMAQAPAPVASATAPVVAKGAPRAMLDAWLAAWNSHDPQRAAELLAEDVEYFDAGFSGIQHGRDAAMEKGFSVFLRGVPDLHWELRGEPIAGVDSIAWEWTFTGTNTGTWGGVPATRQQIQLKGVSLMRLRGGRIVAIASYYDSGTLNRQLGL
jgi:steroid delta-isomerase-like uncharacterized protein